MPDSNKLWMYVIGIIIFFCIYLTWGVLQPFISGFLLAYLLYPFHKILTKYTSSQIISAIILVTIVISIIIFIALFFFQFVYNEFLDILSHMPPSTNKLFEFLGIRNNIPTNSVFEDLNKFSFQNILSKIVSYFFLLLYKVLRGNFSVFLEVFSFVYITPISTIFFLIKMRRLETIFIPILPANIYVQVRRFVDIMNNIMYKFLYAQFLVVSYQIIFYYIMLHNIHIVRINFFLFIVGLASCIPSFGSLSGLLSFVIVSFIENTPLYEGCFVFIIGFLYENYGLIPYFIGNNLSISDFFIWCCVIIGGKLLGAIGFIFAIPLGTVIREFYLKYYNSKKKEHKLINR